jgi:phage-related minor tail protein
MTEAEGLSDALTLETARLRNELSELNRLGESFGSSITRAFASAITDGRRLSDVLRGLALSLADRALTAALRPLGNLVGSLVPFADGGIINSPMLVPFRGGAAVAGEAGPEAVMPLTRGPDGRLGVRGGAATHVTINISTPDVAGFQRSQSQIAASVLKALERGGRNA